MAEFGVGEALNRPAAALAATQRQEGVGELELLHAEARNVRPTMTKAVCVIEEQAFIRDCIQMGLKSACDYEVFTYNGLSDFEGDAKRASCEIVLITCLSEDSKGFAGALAKLRAFAPTIPVLVLGPARFDPLAVAIAGGAKGYIPFSTKFDVVVEVIRVILAGGTYAPLDCLSRPGSTGPLADRIEQRRSAYAELTARELSVVRAIQQGKSNKVIAYNLNMTESTVKVHVRHIMAKLKAKNRTEIAVMSDKIGVSPFEEHALN